MLAKDVTDTDNSAFNPGHLGHRDMADRAVVLRIEPTVGFRPMRAPSLTPVALAGLRAALAAIPNTGCATGGVWAVLLSPSPYHAVLAVQGLRVQARLRPAAVLDP